MRNYLKIQCFVLLIMTLFSASAFASKLYPQTLEDGNLVLVDCQMGLGRYADRSSVVVQEYAPPQYQIAINVVHISFSEDYFRQHKTYVGAPYTIIGTSLFQFRYDWDQKIVYRYSKRDDTWKMWDIHRFNSHGGGNPLIPNTAEVAFVTAYNMRFYDDPKDPHHVISEKLYALLGI